MADTLRRSSRQRKKNPKYMLEVTDEDEFDDLHQVERSDGSSFEQIENEGEEGDDGDDILVASEVESSLQGEGESGEEPEDDLLSMDIDAAVRPGITPRKKKISKPKTITPQKRARKYAGHRNDGLRTRGVLLHSAVVSKEVTILELAGHDPEFCEKMRIERSKYSATITLPYRETHGLGQSGLQYAEIYDDIVRDGERQRFLSWYQAYGCTAMIDAQSMESLDEVSARLYVDTGLPPQNILLGPYQAQHHFSLNHFDSLSVSEAWRTAMQLNSNGRSFDRSAVERKAWILNSGSRIQCMDWAPNQNSQYQFLAVAVEKNRPASIPRSSSLEAQEPFEASVQIWGCATKKQEKTTLMDLSKKPRLMHIICARWGAVRRLSWCPAAVSIDLNPNSIGVLGIVTTDGYVRIVDVVLSGNIKTPYVKYKEAAFASRPPNTIFTCLTWLSAELLAAGCANGYVAIWKITEDIAREKDSPEGQRQSSIAPFWYHALHSTYILSIVGHQPFPCEYITTNAVDGKVRLTSISHPYTDTCYGSRERHIMPSLVYSPHILGIYEIDETDGLRARPLRHMPVSRAVGKASAQVVCMDVGKVHPTLLFGCTDGKAIITNPTRRMFIRRVTDERVDTWQQTWFQHEFVPSARAIPTDYTTSLNEEARRKTHIHPRPGVSRFVESFRPETITLLRSVQATREGKGRSTGDTDGIADTEAPTPSENQTKTAKKKQEVTTEVGRVFEDVQISIFEEEQAVTCVTWNSNLSTGGWAAAGIANGLIRIEDLAM